MISSDKEQPEGLVDIAFKVAKLFYGMNRDPALEFEDFLHELLIKLNKESGGQPTDPPLIWEIAKNKAIDLLRKGNYRAHPSLNEQVEDGEGNNVDAVEVYYRREIGQTHREVEEILVRVAFEQSTPPAFQQVVYKRLEGNPLSDAERQRLSRIKRRIDVTIWDELFGIE